MSVRLVIALAGLAILSGCAPRNALQVRQDSAPPSQQAMTLASDWGYYDVAEGRLDGLLAFPLPASRAGPRDFLLYVSLPANEGEHRIDPADEGAGRGFFIQKKGMLRGIAYFSSGRATVREVWLRPGRRSIDLDVECEDGTRLTGSARLESAPSELQAFKTRYANDLARLAPATQPSTLPEGEPRRGQGG